MLKEFSAQHNNQGGGTVLNSARHPVFLYSLTFFLFLFFDSPAWPYFPEKRLTARAAVLMDAATGRILYQRKPDQPFPPASTTKIVTAIVVLESERRGRDFLSVTKSATRVPSSKLHLRTGQLMTIRDLLYGVLLSSANDASLVLAEGIGGSVERFTEMMTLKARKIGAMHSRFTNPHGLTATGHYSTARDMALIFDYAMKNPIFLEIVQTKRKYVRSITIRRTKRKRVRRIRVRNHNHLLWNFKGAIGGKTGYTRAARRCFVGGASRDGVTLIVSILGSRNLWGDTRRLLEYGFQNYKTLKIASPAPAPSFSDGQVVKSQEKSPSPLFSWEEEKRVRLSEGYIVQVASFREQDRAEDLQREILEVGHEAFLEEAPLDDGGTTYRVRTGPYPELILAQEAARQIESRSGLRAIIVPVSSAAGSVK